MSKADSTDFLINAIIPKPGDPTFSILRTHLLIEDLLWSYLEKIAPNPAVVKQAKLTFSQALQMCRAFSPNLSQDYWMWKAMSELNKLRNGLAHNLVPAEFAVKTKEYISYVINSSNLLSKPVEKDRPACEDEIGLEDDEAQITLYKIDLINVFLYSHAQGALGLLEHRKY